MAPKRVKPANQRPVGVDFAALWPEEHASAVRLFPEVRALTIDRPRRAELTCAFAFGAGEAREFIRIELDMLVPTATGAAPANVAERCVARRKGGPVRHSPHHTPGLRKTE
jgi:hypothetical protein